VSAVETLRHLLLSATHLLPEGGQRTARQNAWTAMAHNTQRARERLEAREATDLLNTIAAGSVASSHR
jgi:hypothetical protein